MGFEINDLSSTEKSAKIVIDKSEVKTNYSDVVKLFQKDADLKGFRKGKVPTNVVESMYSEQINEELRTRLINLNLRKLAADEKLNIVRTKDIKYEDINKDEDFTFSLNLEFIPEIRLAKYESIPANKDIFAVRKKDIDDATKNALTRDYSGLMKAINKKKTGGPLKG